MGRQSGVTPRVKRITLVLSVAFLLAAWILTIDGHFVRQHVPIDPHRATEVANKCDASWQDVTILASDRVSLKGWLFTPRRRNGRAILFVHGRGGTRQHMLHSAETFLGAGYTCLLIDQRGSGGSGGVFSYGVHEPYDLANWARWLRSRPGISLVYGHGGSQGATTLIQSLGAHSPLDGLAVVSAGLGIIGHPYEFVGTQLGVSERMAQLISWPLIEPTFAWIRGRHGFNLRESVSGLDAIRSTAVPVLIIQGAEDRNTPLSGAMQLRDANPGKVDLIVIPHADHEWFSNGKPEVIGRTLAWFEAHGSALNSY
jgi:pimeloyl-ACP methyl ester carboxylesterase